MGKPILLLLLSVSAPVFAEPFLAIQSGHRCSTCHLNPTGGGMRTEFGNAFAQTLLPAKPYSSQDGPMWNGKLMEQIALGGNARFSGRQFEFDNLDDSLNFEVDRITLYLAARLNDKVQLYLDQQVAPGGALNREAWGKVSAGDWYLKAGKIFLPFGLRLEDDTAFVRSVTGINFNSGDNGIELGYAAGNWEMQLAASNGTAGAVEVDDGKQFSLSLLRANSVWRLGVSANLNDTDSGERKIYGIFGGVKTGPLSWLAEYDVLEDQGFGVPGDREQHLMLLETNYRFLPGHNLKLTAEAQSFDGSEMEDRYRYSLIWEYFPVAFTSLRAGFRANDSDSQAPEMNGEEIFIQGHVFF